MTRRYKVIDIKNIETFWTFFGALRYLEESPKERNLYVLYKGEWMLCRIFHKGTAI